MYRLPRYIDEIRRPFPYADCSSSSQHHTNGYRSGKQSSTYSATTASSGSTAAACHAATSNDAVTLTATTTSTTTTTERGNGAEYRKSTYDRGAIPSKQPSNAWCQLTSSLSRSATTSPGSAAGS